MRRWLLEWKALLKTTQWSRHRHPLGARNEWARQRDQTPSHLRRCEPGGGAEEPSCSLYAHTMCPDDKRNASCCWKCVKQKSLKERIPHPETYLLSSKFHHEISMLPGHFCKIWVIPCHGFASSAHFYTRNISPHHQRPSSQSTPSTWLPYASQFKFATNTYKRDLPVSSPQTTLLRGLELLAPYAAHSPHY